MEKARQMALAFGRHDPTGAALAIVCLAILWGKLSLF
jgi:hypothetical protein